MVVIGQPKLGDAISDPCDLLPYRTLECPAGQAILLHNRTLHTSAVNPTDKPRRAICVSYLDGRTRSNQGKAFSLIFGQGALQPETVGEEASGTLQ